MKPVSLTARLTLLFATGWVLSRAVERHFLEQDIFEIEGKIELVSRMLAGVTERAHLDTLPARLDDALVGHAGVAVAVIDTAGKVWYAANAVVFPGEALTRGGTSGVQEWTQNGRSFRSLARTLPIGLPGGEPVIVAGAHGGNIEAASSEGRTRFTIRLPTRAGGRVAA